MVRKLMYYYISSFACEKYFVLFLEIIFKLQFLTNKNIFNYICSDFPDATLVFLDFLIGYFCFINFSFRVRKRKKRHSAVRASWLYILFYITYYMLFIYSFPEIRAEPHVILLKLWELPFLAKDFFAKNGCEYFIKRTVLSKKLFW